MMRECPSPPIDRFPVEAMMDSWGWGDEARENGGYEGGEVNAVHLPLETRNRLPERGKKMFLICKIDA